jgi:hypothetical protein
MFRGAGTPSMNSNFVYCPTKILFYIYCRKERNRKKKGRKKKRKEKIRKTQERFLPGRSAIAKVI